MKYPALLLVALALSPVFAAEPLNCPAGTEARKATKGDKMDEWCEDTQTKKQQGPGRVQDKNGDVLVNLEFQQGEISGHQFTLAGLKLLIAEINESFARQSAPAVVSLIDEHTLRFDMTVNSDAPSMDFEEFRKRIATQAPVCNMFTKMGADFRAIHMYVKNDKKVVLGSTILTRKDCEGAAQ